ncbi:MAG: hypothetical protein E3J78_05620 [Candidatus Cloacimonadota bacterium]|nr:MAG: hypothetical protein E3J78_05620 [Candidatus Cloacimonadota bacterium]
MDWMGLKEEHKLLRHDMKKFAEAELAPQVAEKDKMSEPQTEPVKKLAEIGGLGLLAAEEYDGAGMDFLSLVITVEELAKVSPSFALIVSAHNLVVDMISLKGSDEIKKEYLSILATGEMIAGMSIDTMLHPHISGKKRERLIVSGSFADVFCITVTNEESIQFMVVRKGKGLKTESELMGMRMSGICSFLPSGLEEGHSTFPMDTLDEYFSKMQLLFGGIACGISQSSLELSRSYAKERIQFERPIASFGMVRIMLAEMAMRANASKILVYEAASGNNVLDRTLAAVYATENSFYVADKAVQVYGGYGYTKDYPLEMFFRDAKVIEVFSGTADSQKVLIGKHLTS